MPSDLPPVLALLGAGMVFIFFLVAADKKRYLVRYDLAGWRDAFYLRSLPNFLQALHDARFPHPWPGRLNAVAAALFRFRARPIMKARPALARRNFLRHHLAFQALLEIHREPIADALLAEHIRIVGLHVPAMEDTADRDRLIDFVARAQQQRARFAAALTSYDRELLAALRRRRFFSTLRMAHAIFQEHGFCLMPELSRLRDAERMTAAEIVQELPYVPPTPVRKKRRKTSRRGAG